MTLTVSLPNFPSIPPLVKTFQVTIACSQFLAAPTLTILYIGVDPQPHDIALPIFSTPACQPLLTFTLSASAPIWLSYFSLTTYNALVRISGASLANTGEYLSLVLTTTFNGVVDQQTFDVSIRDPCKNAIFLLSPKPVPDLVLAYAATTQISQLVKAITDVEVNYGIVCVTTYALTSAPTLLRLTGDQLDVDASTLLPADFNQYTITIEAASLLFDGLVTRRSYSFLLTITCEVTSLTPTVSQLTGEHNLDWANSYSPSTFVVPFVMTPPNCYPFPGLTVVDANNVTPSYLTLAGFSSSTRQTTLCRATMLSELLLGCQLPRMLLAKLTKSR